MKTLLVAGAGPIWQLARVWRNEEGSDTHAPEFTMLEWYRPGASLAQLMDETEALLRAVLPPVVRCRGVETSLARFERSPWPRRSAAGRRGRAGHRGRRRRPGRAGRRAAAGGRGLGGPVLPPAAGAGGAASRPRPPDLPDPLARRPGGPGPARPGRPAGGAAVRAVRLRHGAGQRVRGADRPGRAARALRRRPRAAGGAVRPGLGHGRGVPGGPGPRHAGGQRHRARVRPAGDDRGGADRIEPGAVGLPPTPPRMDGRRPDRASVAAGGRRMADIGQADTGTAADPLRAESGHHDPASRTGSAAPPT